MKYVALLDIASTVLLTWSGSGNFMLAKIGSVPCTMEGVRTFQKHFRNPPLSDPYKFPNHRPEEIRLAVLTVYHIMIVLWLNLFHDQAMSLHPILAFPPST